MHLFCDYVSWSGAIAYRLERDNCQLALSGADVVSISDIHINNFVNYFIVSEDQKLQYVYIGLSDENQEGLYEWVDGSEVQITMWDAAQPDNDPNTRDCTEMNADTGMWSNVECSYANSAVVKYLNMTPVQWWSNQLLMVAQKVIRDTTSLVIVSSKTFLSRGLMQEMHAGATAISCLSSQPEPIHVATSHSFDFCLALVLDVLSLNFENAYVGAQVGLKLEEGMYWTGLSDIETPGYYQFVDGSVPTYVNWGPGQPNDKTGKCVAMYSGSMSLSGRWTDAPCYTALPMGYMGTCEVTCHWAQYITAADWRDCLWDSLPLPLVLKIRSGADNIASHYTADVECGNIGAHLASFSNPAEEQYLVSRYNALFPGDNGGYWFGLTDQNDEGNWYWTDGTPLTYTNWHIGEPNDYDSIEECAVMFFDGHLDDALVITMKTTYANDQKIFKSILLHLLPVRTVYIYLSVDLVFVKLLKVNHRMPDCVSDREWKSGPPYCYYASSPTGDGLNSWDGANNWCRQNGGYLVSVTSSYEAQVLRGLVNPSVASYWIGLRESTTGTFENKWQDKNCGFAAPFICKRPEGTVQPIPTPSSVPAGGGCLTTGTFTVAGVYVGGTEAADRYDWQTAKSRCVNALTEAGEIGNLATIHSHEEQGEARSLLSLPLSTECCFLLLAAQVPLSGRLVGLSDLAVDGQYMWTDQYAVTYTNWKPGKPDNTDSTIVLKCRTITILPEYGVTSDAATR
ncbi:putative macrophage mannose receptor 1 [Apostichopus japonicus]|uniref:Putative macrophage mannose receptor 1 n=1 Tax=Stichopus japonicus TaxID=307972 RepID=A0A2G8LK92_STIJA|nr:putative macrophage mannose receptor 1 [Apostichopus japonicus]